MACSESPAHPLPQTGSNPQSAPEWSGGQKTGLGEAFRARKLMTPLDRITRNIAGKRSATRTQRKRGRYIKAIPLKGRADDVAFDATLRSAAVHQLARRQRWSLSSQAEGQTRRPSTSQGPTYTAKCACGGQRI